MSVNLDVNGKYAKQNLAGNSAETKTKETGEGSTFHELDTGHDWLFISGDWVKKKIPDFPGLNKQLDSIDVGKLSPGGTLTALAGITASTASEEFNYKGYTKVTLVIKITSGSWTISILHSKQSGGDFGSVFDMTCGTAQVQMVTPTLTAGTYTYILNVPQPGYIKVSANLITAGTLEYVAATPHN